MTKIETQGVCQEKNPWNAVKVTTPERSAFVSAQPEECSDAEFCIHHLILRVRDLEKENDRLNNELQNKAPSDEGTAADAYFHCAGLIDPWLGDQCGPDTLSNSVCDSVGFLIAQWCLQRERMRSAYLAGWKASGEGWNHEHQPQAMTLREWVDKRDVWIEQKLLEKTDD